MVRETAPIFPGCHAGAFAKSAREIGLRRKANRILTHVANLLTTAAHSRNRGMTHSISC
jgi:hypothetical protein